MNKLFTGIRVALLITALAFVGVGMMPAESTAGACGTLCTSGDLLCDVIDNGDGTFTFCYQPRIP